MVTKFSKKLTVIVCFVLLFFVTGVYATFSYSTGPVISKAVTVDIQFFPWEGEEILPEDEVGYNHRQLIENILNGTMISNGATVQIGMNNPNSALSKEIDDRVTSSGWWDPARYTFGSMDARDNTEMSNLFGLASSKLSFIIYIPPNTKNVRYLFTTGVYLGESGWLLGDKAKPTYDIGERIYPIYKTKLVYKEIGVDDNGNAVYQWVAEKTVLGSAESSYYQNDTFGSGVIQNPAFEPTTFAPVNQEDCESGETHVTLGKDVDSAIWTYVSQSLAGQTDEVNTVLYFRIKPTTTSTVTFTPGENSSNIIIKVYSSSSLQTVVSTVDENGITSFNATANKVYYYTVSGAKNINFTIS